jgi:hypothetical protein
VGVGSYTLDGGFWGGGIIVPVRNTYDLFFAAGVEIDFDSQSIWLLIWS